MAISINPLTRSCVLDPGNYFFITCPKSTQTSLLLSKVKNIAGCGTPAEDLRNTFQYRFPCAVLVFVECVNPPIDSQHQIHIYLEMIGCEGPRT